MENAVDFLGLVATEEVDVALPYVSRSASLLSSGLSVCLCVRERERECVCVCVTERERAFVFVCVVHTNTVILGRHVFLCFHGGSEYQKNLHCNLSGRKTHNLQVYTGSSGVPVTHTRSRRANEKCEMCVCVQ